jgi:hypothetical protein
VEERRLDSLQPGRALVDQGLAQAAASAPLTHLRRRDPGLGQAPLAEQGAQPARVLAVGLGAPLVAPQGARLDRLGKMSDSTGLGQRLADKQPASAGLDRDPNLHAGEAPDPLAHGLRRRADAAALNLARPLLKSVEGDLRSMHVEPGYDRHGASSKAPQLLIRASLSR